MMVGRYRGGLKKWRVYLRVKEKYQQNDDKAIWWVAFHRLFPLGVILLCFPVVTLPLGVHTCIASLSLYPCVYMRRTTRLSHRCRRRRLPLHPFFEPSLFFLVQRLIGCASPLSSLSLLYCLIPPFSTHGSTVVLAAIAGPAARLAVGYLRV